MHAQWARYWWVHDNVMHSCHECQMPNQHKMVLLASVNTKSMQIQRQFRYKNMEGTIYAS